MIHVNLEQYLRELEYLVNIDSGKNNPGDVTCVGKLFADRLAAKDWIVEQINVESQTGKCTVARNRQSDCYDVMLIGHVDTVFPAGETAKRPFRKDEHRAYGVGVLDMKQGDLAILYILEQPPLGVNKQLNIVAIFDPDEENNSIYSAPLINEYARKTNYAFVFEVTSTDCSHTVQRKGQYRSRVIFRGKAGHAGYLLNGGMNSAVNELIYRIDILNGHLNRNRGTSINIGTIKGGTTVNIVPDFAEMEFELRYEDLSEYEKLLQTIERLKIHASETGVMIEQAEVLSTPPIIPTACTLAYEQRLKTLAEANSLHYKSKKRGELSNANHISACGSVCIDVLDPTGDLDHSESEYLEISTVKPNIRFAYLMLCNLAELKSELSKQLNNQKSSQ